MKKEDLKYGMVVELRDGQRFLYQKSKVSELSIDFINLSGGKWWLSLYDLNDDLKAKHRICYTCDIMKVYKDYTCKELIWERKEIKLTDDEKVILRNISKEYKYIVRNECNKLFIFNNKPRKRWDIWAYDGLDSCCDRLPFDHLFQFIEWEDEEPYSIEELLKGE